jgi:transketolase
MSLEASESTNFASLEEKARQIRIDILNAIYSAGKGHIGGAYSIVEILVSLYHGKVLKYNSSNPKWELRDRFILSKGHAGIALYAILADLNYFPKEELKFLNQGRLLGEHPDPRIPGVEVVSGSLGHGLSIGSGMALADKMDKNSRKTFVLMGDGECYEGSVWEAAMFAAHHKLHSLCGIVDRNGLITHGSTESINRLEPFKDKWQAFGWEVFEVDAHDLKALQELWRVISTKESGAPSMVIANSVKGKGVSFMEDNFNWHHGGIDDENFAKAMTELSVLAERTS